MGVTADSLARYIREDTQPTFAAIAGLAITSAVALEWLATGQGPMEAIPQDAARDAPGRYDGPSAALDEQRLTVALETAEIILRRTRKTMTPGRTAGFIIALYNYLPAGEITQQTRDNVIKLFESAA